MESKKEEEVILWNMYHHPSRYSYSQIKKFTNNFSTKLGEGAFGKVYKGVIHQNGVDVSVAVKVLKSSKESEKQFMNEVATTGAVHHQNLVSLLGYCVQGKTRALVYEFMEKGSLDKYIYNTNFENKSSLLISYYKQIYAIALETAKGILYLHQGCRPTILHFDIKPHNVLLDSNFRAKVADFGLARMMGKDDSHVSLTRARGTPGYVAPEVWLNKKTTYYNYGPVTDKSDVYSYGMMLLEMVGRRKNCDPEGNESSSQFYFPMWAYNKIKIGELPLLPPIMISSRLMGDDEVNIVAAAIDDEVDQRDGSSSSSSSSSTTGHGEKDVASASILIERMCLVGLWCIQHIPSNRPSMDRVIQMLEGNVQLGIPPHPFPHLTPQNENVGINYYTYNSNHLGTNPNPSHFSVGSVSWSLEPR
ncbi:rust resistance kinase Lr10-like [Telopea speciosissima]|uniref:rust resistance kinase Lr10-like n=1 Tax=Telopea speciosissima TaxID=54955 RepID=UPI001CC5F2AE|nr:rust resistance kinase Lr10-like [Telopea speciosissima]